MDILQSPAKINLYLKVLGKDVETGYHDIDSIMVPISLYDRILVEASSDLEVTTDGIDEVIPTEKNIVAKIFRETERYVGRELPCLRIKIEKIIPVGAGMGGGSSNGATVLRYLNRKLNLGLKIEEMVFIASQVGSDIPFFLYGGGGHVSGMGDIVKPLQLKPFQCSVLIVNPGIHVDTGDAYSSLGKNNLTKGVKANINIDRINSIGSLKEWVDIIENDFELPVFGMFPEIGALKSEIESFGAAKSFMTGSGSTVVGLFEDNASLERALLELSGRYAFVRKVNLLI